MNIADVLTGFLTCALWSETDQSREDGGDPLDDNYDEDDLAPEARAEALKDVTAFCTDPEVVRLVAECKLDDEQVGHDFLLTRNGHGAGFWDRGLGEAGDRLSALTKPYGCFHLYVGDDGKVHHHG